MPVWDEGILIKSAPDAVAVALEQHTQGDSEETTKAKNDLGSQNSIWNNPKVNGHDIKKEAKKHKFYKILELTWSCWFPNQGIPCKMCPYCKNKL